eukprot:scaffold24052_cov101-Isochrysis_galbana.AAC.2
MHQPGGPLREVPSVRRALFDACRTRHRGGDAAPPILGAGGGSAEAPTLPTQVIHTPSGSKTRLDAPV